MLSDKVSIVFPMAGLGSRFEYQFKPFIFATEYCFIELAKQPFDILPNKEFYFIVRKTQEQQYNVTHTLNKLFPKDIIHICLIQDTDGPLQTLQQAIQKYSITGPCFVCDCDHQIDITPMLSIDYSKHSVLIPTWHIEPNDYPNWGKVKVDGTTYTFYEKELVTGKDIRGLIGCYLFRNIRDLLDFPSFQNISDILKHLKNVHLVPIHSAHFFGTPSLLQTFRYKRAQKYTLFIDIDGTLIHQNTKELLPYTFEKLKDWKSSGHKIVFTTACPEDKLSTNVLELPHDHILYNLTSGPRYVINDHKPYHPSYTMAQGIMLPRNIGIQNVQLPNKFLNISDVLIGGSTCQTYLMDNHRVRKYAYGKENVTILKRQYEDIQRFNFYLPSICPLLFEEHMGYNDYYYDMEYLEHYTTLSTFTEEIIYTVILKILNDLHEHVYCYKKNLKPQDGKQWIQTFMKEKIIPRYSLLMPFKTIILNGFEYPSISYLISSIDLDTIIPEYICPIHGDLTFENIMYDGTNYKLIDLAGSRYMDAPELDIGKILQSLVCRYSEWNPEKELVQLSENEFCIPDKYLNNHIPYKPHFKNYKVCLFYMCMHLIRIVPFIMKKSEKHKQFVQLLAIHYLNIIHKQF